MLPRRIPKEPKRENRWRSPAHCKWVRGFACASCGSITNIEAAHVRLGSHTALGRKPDDWRVVPLCAGPYASADGTVGCHDLQHKVGEFTFWATISKDPEALIRELIQASPKRREIEAAMRERRP